MTPEDAISDLESFLQEIERFPNDDTFRYETDREGAKAILAAVKSRGGGASDDWRLIETAPTDGSTVLLYEDFEPAVCEGWFSEGEWQPSRGPAFFKQPTHWMPRLAPPNSEMNMIEGIAGEPIEVGQAVARGPDGKYYLAEASEHIQHIAPAAEPIKKDNVIYLDKGMWRPVNNPKK